MATKKFSQLDQANQVEADFFVGVTAAGVDKKFPALQLLSGTYTPNLTITNDCSNLEAFVSFYNRVGKFVTVFFRAAGDCTAETPARFTMTVPLGASFDDSNKAFGMGAGDEFSAQISAVDGGAAAVSIGFTPHGETFAICGSFMYEVL